MYTNPSENIRLPRRILSDPYSRIIRPSATGLNQILCGTLQNLYSWYMTLKEIFVRFLFQDQLK